MKISRTHPHHHQQDPDHMDGWIHKTAIFSEQMHQQRRQQEEENIAELHNHNGRIIKLQFSLFELNAYTVNTKNHNNNSIINNN